MTQLTFADLLQDEYRPRRGSLQRYLSRVADLEALQRAGVPRRVRGRSVFPTYRRDIRPSASNPLVVGIQRARSRGRVRATRSTGGVLPAGFLVGGPTRATGGFTVGSTPARPTPGFLLTPETVPAGEMLGGRTAAGAAAKAAATEGAEAAAKGLGLLGRLGRGAGIGLGVSLLMAALVPGGETRRFLSDVTGFGSGRSFRDQLNRQIRDETEALLFQTRMERLQAGVRDNLLRLQRSHPDLFLELAVGQKLPRGAAVFGGGPRTDYLEAVAAMMAEGQIQRDRPAEIRLSGTLDALRNMDLSGVKFSLR